MKKDRRSFLTKMGVSLSAFMSWSIAGLTNPSKQIPNEMNSERDVIKQIKPLGFQWETSDPFLFCVHHEDKFPKGNDQMGPATGLSGRNIGNDFIIKDGFRMYHGKKVPGFPGHPHRGFETITIVREGFVDHADSIGAAGRYGDGDVQWMTAGKGVQHSEMFPLLHKDKENPMELFQIWLNLPKKNKMVEPHFKMLWREDLPTCVQKDTNGNEIKIEVIAGKIFNCVPLSPPPDSWAADYNNDVAVWNIHMSANAQFTLPKAKEMVNRTLYFYIGENIQIAGKSIPKYHSVEVVAGTDLLIQNGNHISKILVLQGRPIGEQVIQYGPFVMNTKEEIQQAFSDYQNTQFGGWPWPKLDQVHDKNSGRFAIHADGTKEVKSS